MRATSALAAFALSATGCGGCTETAPGFCCLSLDDCRQFDFDEIVECGDTDEACIGNQCLPRPDAAAFDARPDGAVVCDWTEPVIVPNVNSSVWDGQATESDDRLTLYFSRTTVADSESDIYVATRSSATLPFGAPTRLPMVNTEFVFDDAPEPSATGLELFFYRQVPDSAMRGIWTATRTDPGATFGPPQTLGVNGLSPSLSGDGLTLYFITPGSPNIVHSISRPTVGGLWSAPAFVMSTEYTAIDVSLDELRILLSAGPVGFTQPPVAIATRMTKEMAFGSPVPITAFSVADDDARSKSARWCARDRVIYAGLELPSGQGLTDIYVSECR